MVMTSTATVKLVVRDIPHEDWPAAARLAQRYLKEYPDRIGFNNLVVYTGEGLPGRIVYRTKTSIIVRGV